MKLFSRFFGSDEEKVALDRRLFLVGATVTAGGLILPKPIISVPAVAALEPPTWPVGPSGATGPFGGVSGFTCAPFTFDFNKTDGLWIPVGPSEPEGRGG